MPYSIELSEKAAGDIDGICIDRATVDQFIGIRNQINVGKGFDGFSGIGHSILKMPRLDLCSF